MKVVVTGATGFIGKHVLAELNRRSVKSVAMVRTREQKSIVHLGCSIVQHDLNYACSNAFELLGRPDVIIHLAWSGLPNYKSLHHFENELPVQYQFLKNLIKSGLQNLVVAGTCFEYGMNYGSLSEELSVKPNNPYGFAKDALRCQLEYLKSTHQFNLTWARLFYLYGEGQPESSLLPQIRQAVEQGEQIFNMSGGEQLRDYLPVEKVASYLVSLALAEKDIGIVNICSGNPVSVRKLVENWIKENGWTIKLNLGHYPYPDYEPFAFWGDPRKISSIIGEAR